MEFRIVRAAAVFEHEAVVAAVVGFAHRGVDADLRRHASHDELLDVFVLQDRVQVGGVKRALAGLVDHRLAGLGIEFRNNVVAGFAAHQNAAHRAGVADGRGAAAANFFDRRQIGEVRPMAFPRMEHRESGGAPRRQELLVRLDGAAQLRNVVAEHLAKAAGLEKIALHVDDQERAMLRRERKLVRFGGEIDGRGHQLGPLRGLRSEARQHGRKDRACRVMDRWGPTSGFGLPTAWVRAPLLFAAAQGPGDCRRRSIFRSAGFVANKGSSGLRFRRKAVERVIHERTAWRTYRSRANGGQRVSRPGELIAGV